MKKTDVAMIVLIIAVSAGIAYFIASSVFGGMSEDGAKVQTVDSITGTVEPVDTAIFNETSINPSVEVNISNTDTATSDEPAPASIETPQE
jgi:ABC-type cobalt transport system substrate-binding protein